MSTKALGAQNHAFASAALAVAVLFLAVPNGPAGQFAPHPFTGCPTGDTCYSPSMAAGFYPSNGGYLASCQTLSDGADTCNVTEVYALLVTPDDHSYNTTAQQGAWNVTLTAHAVSATGAASRSSAMFSIGFTMQRTYGAFYPTWSDKLLNPSGGGVSAANNLTCENGGQIASTNYGVATTAPLTRDTEYNFSMTWSSQSVVYGVTAMDGSSVWTHTNNTGINTTAYSYPGFSVATGGQTFSCPEGAGSPTSPLRQLTVMEQAYETYQQGTPPYDFYLLGYGVKSAIGFYVDESFANDGTFAYHAAPQVFFSVGYSGGQVKDRLNNQYFIADFAIPAGLPASLAIAELVPANTNGIGISGFVLAVFTGYGNAHTEVESVSYVGNGIASAFCHSGCTGNNAAGQNYTWTINVNTSASVSAYLTVVTEQYMATYVEWTSTVLYLYS